MSGITFSRKDWPPCFDTRTIYITDLIDYYDSYRPDNSGKKKKKFWVPNGYKKVKRFFQKTFKSSSRKGDLERLVYESFNFSFRRCSDVNKGLKLDLLKLLRRD